MFLCYNNYYIFYMFITGLLMFSSMRNHLLLTLLSLEYLVLCIYIFMIYYILNYMGDIYFVLMFLGFSVCEGVLGLSILVALIRNYGNDQVNSLSIILW
uniref:NADH-ubiquinone oxidoreductase chain 4L n=1 Tax=Dicyphus sp. TaxID=2931289 RepID=A0A8T9ZXY8_9HEMI|nr:NADH dehydrogenase subunit 4L [Dicyphus sp.]